MKKGKKGIKKADNRRQTKKAVEYAKKETKKAFQRLQKELAGLGEKMCEHAREYGDYQDRTGTTRSSFKFRVVKDGEIVEDGGYQEVEGTELKKDNPEELVDRVLDEQGTPQRGISLVFANGTEWADYLEDKGYNVTHLTEEWAKGEVEKLLADIFSNR